MSVPHTFVLAQMSSAGGPRRAGEGALGWNRDGPASRVLSCWRGDVDPPGMTSLVEPHVVCSILSVGGASCGAATARTATQPGLPR